MKKLQIGSIVHYLAKDDPAHRCVAAIVTDHFKHDDVNLVAFGYVTGQTFFHERVPKSEPFNDTGSWHWPGNRFCSPADRELEE